ncbi:restriction endonuclease subunit S [Pseudomonas seleniipraecipitans]|uniref:Restriction endonuclease subunit S n=1 Tax=Phytopseudomonas seleniipraecipitans TaxID=640205 RepID=A0ABY5JE08_9GAMM|nr:restriction endonuclease subunit S [Pseudomonas seleniipraecipitans]UUD64660.1 restriction endonuclease subunit S [Pseudomonas seleniipraecipitans]
MSFPSVALGDVVSFKGGGTPSRDQSTYWGGDIPWATVKDFNDGYLIRTTRDFITPEGLKNSASNLISAGTVIIPTRMALGKAAIAQRDVAINQDLKAVVPSGEVDPRYLLWYFIANASQIQSMGKGATVKGVTLDQLRKLQFPLPPFPEQRRIAAILDKAEALRAKRSEAIAKLDQLLQSVFLEMFGDPLTNPKEWPAVTVAEIAEVQGGLQFSASRKDIPNSVPYLRVANVQRGFLDLAEIKEMGATVAEVQRIRLNAGDILVVEGHGNPDEIGRCAVWDGSISECIHQNHLIRVRANPETVTPSFLASYLNSDVGSRWLKGTARTTSGLNTISVKKVRETQVLLPPLALQQRWDDFVLSVADRRSVALVAAVKNASLFEALQAQAFSGKL